MKSLILFFLLLAFASEVQAQDSLTAIKQEWKKMVSSYNRRGMVAQALLSRSGTTDSTLITEIKTVAKEFYAYTDTLQNLDSLSIDKARLLSLRLATAMGRVLVELEKKPEMRNTDEMRRLMSDLMAAENRCHTATIRYNSLCETYRRNDLMMQSGTAIKN